MKYLKKHKMHGFTLIELAVVLTIIALLVGGMLVPLGARLDQQAYSDTQARLDKATEALTGFAILNGRLPCPSITSDGLEQARVASGVDWVCGSATQSDDSSAANNASWGDLPWGTLGLSAPYNADAWNYRLRYAVRTKLAIDKTATTTVLDSSSTSLGSATGLVVYDSIAATNLISNAVFVIYSHGKNSAGGTLIGVPVTPATTNPTSADELQNLPSNATGGNEAGNSAAAKTARRLFYSRTRTGLPTAPAVTPLEFDDLVTWMSPNTLTAKLVAAGVWTP
jgi:prepilin-type N-terminal cleavage/methylation domain-containing protein